MERFQVPKRRSVFSGSAVAKAVARCDENNLRRVTAAAVDQGVLGAVPAPNWAPPPPAATAVAMQTLASQPGVSTTSPKRTNRAFGTFLSVGANQESWTETGPEGRPVQRFITVASGVQVRIPVGNPHEPLEYGAYAGDQHVVSFTFKSSNGALPNAADNEILTFSNTSTANTSGNLVLTPLAGGWTRAEMRLTVLQGNGNAMTSLAISMSGSASGELLYLTAPQFEFGSAQSAYIPTFGSPVTVGGPGSGPTPAASFTLNSVGLTVQTAYNGTATNEAISSWSWGDGQTTVGQNPGHVYASPGTYVVQVVISDGNGNTSSATVTVEVSTQSMAGFSAMPSPYEVTLAPAWRALRRGTRLRVAAAVSGPGTLTATLTLGATGEVLATATASFDAAASAANGWRTARVYLTVPRRIDRAHQGALVLTLSRTGTGQWAGVVVQRVSGAFEAAALAVPGGAVYCVEPGFGAALTHRVLQVGATHGFAPFTDGAFCLWAEVERSGAVLRAVVQGLDESTSTPTEQVQYGVVRHGAKFPSGDVVQIAVVRQ